MRIVKSAAAMQRLAQKWRLEKRRIGFVPTMGYLHAGHLSLIEAARRGVGKQGVLVVSIYVNPTQFGPKEDFARYPRDLRRDLKLCRQAGVDMVFAPNNEQMYPGLVFSSASSSTSALRSERTKSRRTSAVPFSTYVLEETLSRGLEGASRPTHFRGVTTIVAKLFNVVQPDIAVFGAKDYQQAAIVKRMVRDLNFPLRIIVAPTLREPDGLAWSSRNQYLKGPLRQQATVLWRAIQKAREILQTTKTAVPARRLKTDLKRFIESKPDARLDYVEFFDPDTLVLAPQVRRGTHVALAAFIGSTRLIDNARL